MTAKKYLVFNIEELRSMLPKENFDYLVNLTGWIDERRAAVAEERWSKLQTQETNKAASEGREPRDVPRPTTEPPTYFVLNMRDKYAMSTIEHYLDQIDSDGENRSEPGVKAAAAAARDIRNRSKFLDTKLPD